MQYRVIKMLLSISLIVCFLAGTFHVSKGRTRNDPVGHADMPSKGAVSESEKSGNENRAERNLPMSLPGPHDDPLIPPLSVAADNRQSRSSKFEHDITTIFHPHGEQVCATGCAVSRHPTKKLTSEDFEKLLAEFSEQPQLNTGPALDALLFYGQQSLDHLEIRPDRNTDSRHLKFLREELSRSHVKVAIRIVDEYGNLRAHCGPARVPMHRRHVFSLTGNDLQPLVASGTVKRVGLDYLWTRL